MRQNLPLALICALPFMASHVLIIVHIAMRPQCTIHRAALSLNTTVHHLIMADDVAPGCVQEIPCHP